MINGLVPVITVAYVICFHDSRVPSPYNESVSGLTVGLSCSENGCEGAIRLQPSESASQSPDAVVSMNAHDPSKKQSASFIQGNFSHGLCPLLTSALLGLAERSSHPPPLSDPSVPSDVWYYPSTAQVNDNNTRQLPDISASSMIGPTSTFYNPEDPSLHQGLEHGQYQQWIEGYGPQQQQDQQTQHHYSQQMLYDTSYHGGLHVPIPLSYQFTQPQYESSSSLSQYDGSTTGTVTQSNVGQNRDNSYQGQSNDLYSQVYPEIIAMKQSAASTSERIPVANYSHSTPSSKGPQQNPSQQSRQQQARRRPPRAQQNHAHRFLAHPSSSEYTSSNPSSSHSSSLTPPSIVWNTEPGYSNPKPIENARHGGQSSIRVLSSNSGSSRPPTSQNTPPTTNSPNPHPTTSGVLGSSPRASPPRPSESTFVPEKTGHKRKRAKKNEPAQLSGGGGESDSDSEDEEAGGISVGMGGLGVVGKGRGTKGSRLWVILLYICVVEQRCSMVSLRLIWSSWMAEWMNDKSSDVDVDDFYWRPGLFHISSSVSSLSSLLKICLSMTSVQLQTDTFYGRVVGLILTPCTATATSIVTRYCPIRLEDPEPARTARSSRCAEIFLI